MKKIMKKALSLMLALVMMLSLAPMTAQAAAGDDIANGSITSGMYGAYLEAGATGYFEVGQFDPGEYGVTVEGTGAFTVTPCVIGDTTWYKEGANSVPATDGVVNTTMSILEGNDNDGYGALAITNNSDAEVEYTITVDLPEGTQGNPKAVTLAIGAPAAVTVPAESQYFIAAALPEMNKEYMLTITGTTGFGVGGGYMMTPDTNGVVEVTAMANMYSGGKFTTAITNNTDSEQTYTLTLANVPLGAESNPDSFTAGTTVTTTLSGNQYWYSWVSTETGVLKFAVDEDASANGWYINAINDYSYDTKQMSDAWGDPATFELDIEEGDTIKVGVSVPDGEGEDANPYAFGAGTVVFSTTVGEKTEEDDGDNTGGDNPGGDNPGGLTGEEINANYYYNYTELGTGTVTVFPEFGYATTLYTFRADEAGTYTVTLSDNTGAVGYYGSNEWFPYDYSLDTGVANTYTYTLNYTEANAPALIGISGTTMTDITITKAGEAEIVTIPEYTAYTSAEPYVYTGETATLTYVNVEATDKVVDKAVYASDGYYHLNSVDGPVLMVNIYDELFSIANAPSTGKVVTVNYGVDGKEVVSKTVWNDVLLAYAECADKETGLYPLTSQLVYFYQTYGEQQRLYTESGYVGGQFSKGMGEDAWMFACMYVPNKADGTIVLPPAVIDPIEKDADGKVTNSVATEEAVKDIIEQAKEEGKDVVIKTTTEGLTITIANEDLANATAMKIDVKVEIKEDVKDETVAKNDKITKDNFVMKIEFAHEGKLPAEATIVIPVPAEVAKAYKTLYYYQIMEDGSLKYVCDAPINSDGKAVVTQDHCSDYVLLTEKVDAPLVKEIAAPKTGDSTNYALWLAVLGLGVVAIAGSVVMKKREF